VTQPADRPRPPARRGASRVHALYLISLTTTVVLTVMSFRVVHQAAIHAPGTTWLDALRWLRFPVTSMAVASVCAGLANYRSGMERNRRLPTLRAVLLLAMPAVCVAAAWLSL